MFDLDMKPDRLRYPPVVFLGIYTVSTKGFNTEIHV